MACYYLAALVIWRSRKEKTREEDESKEETSWQRKREICTASKSTVR